MVEIVKVETPLDVIAWTSFFVVTGIAIGYLIAVARRWWKRWQERQEEKAWEKNRMNTAQWYRGQKPQ